MSQSRRMSLIEAITNVALGYALAVATQNLALGGVFTAISLIRGYALRRLFERWRQF